MDRPNIKQLYIIQDSLRNPEQLPDMISFVQEGGMFDKFALERFNNKDANLIELAQFPDGKLFVHNGHHRVVAIALGRTSGTIATEEYYIKHWKYEDYMDIVFTNDDDSWRGYVTPFDVRTEARLEDIGIFKDNIKRLYDNLGPVDTMRFIIKHPHLYKKPKTKFTVMDLANEYKHDTEFFGWATIGYANVNPIRITPTTTGAE